MQQDEFNYLEVGHGKSQTGAGVLTNDLEAEVLFMDPIEAVKTCDSAGDKVLGLDFVKEWFPAPSALPLVPLTDYQPDPQIPGLFVGERNGRS